MADEDRAEKVKKFILKSKVFQGVIISLIPIILQLFGIKGYDTLPGDLSMLIDLSINLIGGAWIMYGRVKDGETKLTVLPKKDGK